MVANRYGLAVFLTSYFGAEYDLVTVHVGRCHLTHDDPAEPGLPPGLSCFIKVLRSMLGC